MGIIHTSNPLDWRTCMFTGIVAEAGTVERIKPTAKSIELTVRASVCGRGLKLGQFDLLQETWWRTNLQFAKAGSLVNLERPLRAGGELGGHFVTGHIDGI